MIELRCEYLSLSFTESVFLSNHLRVESESTLCKFLNAKELLVSKRRDIWNLGDCNEKWTHKHVICKKYRFTPKSMYVTWYIIYMCVCVCVCVCVCGYIVLDILPCSVIFFTILTLHLLTTYKFQVACLQKKLQ